MTCVAFVMIFVPIACDHSYSLPWKYLAFYRKIFGSISHAWIRYDWFTTFVTDWSTVADIAASTDHCFCFLIHHELSPIQTRVAGGAGEAGGGVLPVLGWEDSVKNRKMTVSTARLPHPPVIVTQPTEKYFHVKYQKKIFSSLKYHFKGKEKRVQTVLPSIIKSKEFPNNRTLTFWADETCWMIRLSRDHDTVLLQILPAWWTPTQTNLDSYLGESLSEVSCFDTCLWSSQ